MSRLGKQTISIPAGVTVTFDNHNVLVKGAKNQLSLAVRPEITVSIADGVINVSVVKETKESSAFWGTTRVLISNMIKGVVDGFEKKLQMVGVGYRVTKISDTKISLTVGFSHPVEFEAPEGVTFAVEGNDTIIVKGTDKQLVGLTAAKIRKIKKPEPYKGKGIKYDNEVIKRKAGKTGTV